jgi:hypothetical protein
MKHKRFFIIIPILLVFTVPYLVMLLWNSIIVSILALKSISYLQAAGLFILCRILFGGFNFGRPRKTPFADAGFRNKWLSMTAEEKENFKIEWRKRKNNCEDLK